MWPVVVVILLPDVHSFTDFGDLCVRRRSNIKDGRLAYTMMKSGKVKSDKLMPPVLAILERYPETIKVVDELIFPILARGVDYLDPIFVRKQISSRMPGSTNI